MLISGEESCSVTIDQDLAGLSNVDEALNDPLWKGSMDNEYIDKQTWYKHLWPRYELYAISKNARNSSRRQGVASEEYSAQYIIMNIATARARSPDSVDPYLSCKSDTCASVNRDILQA